MRPLLILFWLIAAGCVTGPVERPTEAAAVSPVIDCQRLAFHAALQEKQATLYLPGLALSLPRMDSSAGSRYAANNYVLWLRGDTVTFRTPERSFEHCRLGKRHNAWAGAWLRGVDFRAGGNEPGWLLEISNGRQLVLLWDYGKRRLETPLLPARRRDNSFSYHADGDTDLFVQVIDRPCRDSMKGDAHDYAVRVVMGERELLGCGRGRMPVEGAP